jgi:hypothetical protein
VRRPAFVALAALWLAGTSAAAIIRWRAAEPVVVARSAQIPRLLSTAVDTADSALVNAEEAIASNDLFRLANAPAAVRFDVAGEPGVDIVGVSQPAAIRPTMTLKAIVGGPPWQAVVDGLPGQPANTLVRTGATYDKLVARQVTRDSVVIQGPDTTWVLSFRRPE